MKYRFKPLNNMHLYFMYFAYIFDIAFFDIGCIIVCFDEFDVEFFITCVILTAIPFFAYMIVRLLYPYKYIIDNEYLLKFKRNKIIFKIKIEDIKYIVIKKTNVLNFLKFIISLISGYNLSTSNITTMSIIYEKCEILNDSNNKDFKREEVVENKEINEKEYVEILPYKKIKQICKIMNIDCKKDKQALSSNKSS